MTSNVARNAAQPRFGVTRKFLEVDRDGVPIDIQVPVTSVTHLAGATVPTEKVPVQLLDGAGAAIALVFPVDMSNYVGQRITFALTNGNSAGAHSVAVTGPSTLGDIAGGTFTFPSGDSAASMTLVVVSAGAAIIENAFLTDTNGAGVAAEYTLA